MITVQTLMTTRAPAVLETEGKNLEQREFFLNKIKVIRIMVTERSTSIRYTSSNSAKVIYSSRVDLV